MLLLDTDHMTFLQWAGPEGIEIRKRLRASADKDVVTSIVSYEEQTRGWLSRSARAKTPAEQIKAYDLLHGHLEAYCRIPVLKFDEIASSQFQQLAKAKVRIATMDLRIAAIAIAHGATILTRNLSDFSRIPGVKAEDWSS